MGRSLAAALWLLSVTVALGSACGGGRSARPSDAGVASHDAGDGDAGGLDDGGRDAVDAGQDAAIDLTGFPLELVPGTGSLTAQWEMVDGARYRLHLSTAPSCLPVREGSSCPDARVVEDVRSPHRVSGLHNGTAYYVRVEAQGTEGRGFSEEVGTRPDVVAVDSLVRAMALGADGTVYLGGAFTQAGVQSGTLIPLDRTRGRPTYADYPLVDGDVSVVIPDGDGGYYFGGYFTRVGGVDRRNVAHVLVDGSVDSNWAPEIDDGVWAMALMDGVLYLGGWFTQVNGQARSHLAAVDAQGKLTDWNPGADEAVERLVARDGVVYVAGSFAHVGGQARHRLAAIDAQGQVTAFDPQGLDEYAWIGALAVSEDALYVGGSFTLDDGATTRRNLAAFSLNGELSAFAPEPNSRVSALAVAQGKLYVGGVFSTIADTPRARIARFDLAQGTLDAFAPDLSGADIAAIAVADDTVYVGGALPGVGGEAGRAAAAFDLDGNRLPWRPIPLGGFTWALAVSGPSVVLAGGFFAREPQTRRGLLALDREGALTAWVADIDQGDVYALATADDVVYAGGRFDAVLGTPRGHLAAIHADGTLKDWAPSTDGEVWALAAADDVVYVGGDFIEVDGEARSHLAAVDVTGKLTDWQPRPNRRVRVIRVKDDVVYVGGDFWEIDDQPNAYIAAIGTDGALHESFRPGATNSVLSIATSVDSIYVGGAFHRIGGEERVRLAALDLDGAVRLDWDHGIASSVTSFPDLSSLAVADGIVYVGGLFDTLGGQPRRALGAIEAHGGVTPWNPDVREGDSEGWVFCLAVDGDRIHVAGTFTRVGDAPRRNFATLER